MKSSHPFPSLAVINLAQKYLSPTSRVLDVGCNRGQTGKILKRKTGCQVIGIDNSQTAIKKAKKVLDQVILADIELEDWKLGKKRFDLIILSNVLEHLRDPLAALRRSKKYLKLNGHYLIAIPNVAFWPVRLKLLLGKFEYENQGTLDKDHLRFFTLRTFKKLIVDAGLEIKDLKTNYLGWRERIAKFWPTLLASQFVALCSLPPLSSSTPGVESYCHRGNFLLV